MDDCDWMLSAEKACDWLRIEPGVTVNFYLGLPVVEGPLSLSLSKYNLPITLCLSQPTLFILNWVNTITFYTNLLSAR